MAKIQLVRCTQHGESCCWVQLDGTHASTKACTCFAGEPYLCPIDGHAIRFLTANPEWGGGNLVAKFECVNEEVIHGE
jgi:hypothetical protein